MTTATIELGYKGKFIFEISDGPNGENKRKVAEFDNLITNIGLNNLLGRRSSFTGICAVGSGSATPTTADTALQTSVARQARTGTNTTRDGAPNYTVYHISTYAFGQGAAAGNLTEVGVGTDNSATSNVVTSSRALIVDGSGNPTTITVLPNEYLTVTYILALAPVVTDTIVTVGGYTCTVRAANVTGWDASYVEYPAQSNCVLSTAALQAITSRPGGTQISGSSVSVAGYTNGTYFRDITIQWAPATGAITAQSMFTISNQNWQIGFSPNLVKTVNDNVSITLRFTATRL